MTSNSNNPGYNRREFLENSARNAAGLAVGAVGLGAARSANETLQLGIIGVGRQGLELGKTIAQMPGAQVVAICDVDKRQLKTGQQDIGVLQSTTPITTTQHEALLDREDVDAVVVATPDHWHARLAFETLQKKKDLLLETPVTHAIEEGEQLLQLTRNSEQVIQVGLPQRYGSHYQAAVQLIQSGYLGKIYQAKAWAVHRRKSIGCCATSPLPSGVDYARWLGPAQARAFQPNRFHHNWPWFWEYGSGELGLWGVHQLDVIRWALRLDLPTRMTANGGRYSFQDDRETPDTLAVMFEFGDVDVTWEHRQWSNRGIEGRSSGVAFYGESGTLIVDRSGWKVYDHRDERHAQASDIRTSQVEHFLHSVRHRSQPLADLEQGVKSSHLCHLANIAHRTDRELIFDPESITFPDDAVANSLLKAPSRQS